MTIRWSVVSTYDHNLQPILLYAADAIQLAARAISKIIQNHGEQSIGNGTLFRKYASNIRYTGASGPIVLDYVSERQPTFTGNTVLANGSLNPVWAMDMVLVDEHNNGQLHGLPVRNTNTLL